MSRSLLPQAILALVCVLAVCPVNAIELGVFRKREVNTGLNISTTPENSFRIWYGIRFSNAKPDFPVIVANHKGDTELEPAAAFNDFSHAGNFNHALV